MKAVRLTYRSYTRIIWHLLTFIKCLQVILILFTFKWFICISPGNRYNIHIVLLHCCREEMWSIEVDHLSILSFLFHVVWMWIWSIISSGLDSNVLLYRFIVIRYTFLIQGHLYTQLERVNRLLNLHKKFFHLQIYVRKLRPYQARWSKSLISLNGLAH